VRSSKHIHSILTYVRKEITSFV